MYPGDSVGDDDLAEVLLASKVSEGLPCILKGEDAVDDRMDVVGGEGAVHVFEIRATADSDRPQRGLAQEEVDEVHALGGRVEHADQRDLAVVGH